MYGPWHVYVYVCRVIAHAFAPYLVSGYRCESLRYVIVCASMQVLVYVIVLLCLVLGYVAGILCQISAE